MDCGPLFSLLVTPQHVGFPIAQMVKNLPAVQEIQVRSLGQEDTLEKEMAIHSIILTWRILWTENWGPWDHKESDTPE